MASIAAGADAGAGTPPPTSPPLATDGGHAGQHVSFGAEEAAGGETQDDIQHYAELLGVNWEEDTELLWVVEEAFHAPLPETWTEHTDDEARCYFFHEVEAVSAWEHPTDAVYRELIRLIQAAHADNPGAAPAQQAAYIHDHLRQVHQRAMDALEGWSGPYPSEVGEYYYNEGKKISTWHCPVAEWEHELVIRHAVLCRCLLPEQTVVGPDGSIAAAGGEGTLAGAVGANLLQALQLPLNLLRRDSADQPEQPEDAPSTTRSYHTARSVASTSARGSLSGRSGDKLTRPDKAAISQSTPSSPAPNRQLSSSPTRGLQGQASQRLPNQDMREDDEAEANEYTLSTSETAAAVFQQFAQQQTPSGAAGAA